MKDSFTEVERASPHTLLAGYRKGGEQAGVDVLFNIVPQAQTASELYSNDQWLVKLHCKKLMYTTNKSIHVYNQYNYGSQLYGSFMSTYILIFIGDSDFHLDDDTVTVTPTGDAGVAIIFESDDDSNELGETLTLTLVPKPFTLQTFPRGEAVFFMNSINLTILDYKGIVHNYLQSMVPPCIDIQVWRNIQSA